jgi:hypothetical protein
MNARRFTASVSRASKRKDSTARHRGRLLHCRIPTQPILVGQTRSFGDDGSMSGSPDSGHGWAIYECTPWAGDPGGASRKKWKSVGRCRLRHIRTGCGSTGFAHEHREVAAVGARSRPGRQPPATSVSLPCKIVPNVFLNCIGKEVGHRSPQACEGRQELHAALDLAGRLREQINADGEVIRVRGVPKAHPAVRDLLQAQAFVTRTLARLGLDVEPLRSGPGRPPTASGW